MRLITLNPRNVIAPPVIDFYQLVSLKRPGMAGHLLLGMVRTENRDGIMAVVSLHVFCFLGLPLSPFSSTILVC